MPQQVSHSAMPTTSRHGQAEHQEAQQIEPEVDEKSTDINDKPAIGDVAADITTSIHEQQVNGETDTAQPNGVSDQTPKTATIKLNGLKNRITQRPPPLILDRVLNSYDNAIRAPAPQSFVINQQQQSNSKLTLQARSETNNNDQQSRATNQINDNYGNKGNTGNNSNSANQKFWASLNQNAAASRPRAVVTIRGSDVIESAVSTKESTGGQSNTHPDLIISHRNSVTVPTNRASVEQPPLHHQQSAPSSEVNSIDRHAERCEHSTAKIESTDPISRPHDMSNNSEFDDSSTHGGAISESDGGNLIGVDNPTPPASTGLSDGGQSRGDDLPASASSSRPRSNNPFLAMEDELLSSVENATNNNFHKRPASFIAATDSASSKHLTNIYNSNETATDQLLIQEQFNNFKISQPNARQEQLAYSQLDNQAGSVFNDQQQGSDNQRDNLIPKAMPMSKIQHGQQQSQSLYEISGQSNNYININIESNSIDNESAVYNPPLSVNMRLPHWTDATYELNNAILEVSSVAGGAENGEFIYIVESGDIILELDHVRVSGFTLSEFNELLESRSMHPLKAVHARHCRGLPTDLKFYLNRSFPKNSPDKELQDLIRDNIYRRTIPCTTRPPKEGEIDKVDYHFLSKEQFIEMNNNGMLLECGMFGGHYYGTMRPFSDLNSLTIYGASKTEISNNMRQPLHASHPAIGLVSKRQPPVLNMNQPPENLYENQESMRLLRIQLAEMKNQPDGSQLSPRNFNSLDNVIPDTNQSSIVAVDTESLPYGWERVIDQNHGTYYIDHNTQRTQYERPYEIELTKGSMGFGFTLVEADNGALLVRSIIPGGPAQLSGVIKPGDILISAVGVSVAGLQHTDIARLFSTFAVGDRVRLTFARGAYMVDANLVPDEYLFSNGTNGNMAVAVNSNYLNYFNQSITSQSPHIMVNQEFEFITVTLKRGDQGFGFTISDSVAGQKVKKIQNNETCTNLRQGDTLVVLNGQDITKLTHKEVVEQLKNCPPGQDATLIVKRRKRFRSKTPMAMHTESEEFSLESTPQRNCKTPSLDGLMLRRSIDHNGSVSRTLFPDETQMSQNQFSTTSPIIERPFIDHNLSGNYSSLPITHAETQSLYGLNPVTNAELYYYNQTHMPLPSTTQIGGFDPMVGLRPYSMSETDFIGIDTMTNSVHPSETSLNPRKYANVSGINQINQYNNFMNNDKLVMMQMQQQQSLPQIIQSPALPQQSSDYHHMPLYTNSDMLKEDPALIPVPLPVKPIAQYVSELPYDSNLQNNYYANNEEIALQRVQYGGIANSIAPLTDHQNYMQSNYFSRESTEEQDEYEYHQVDLARENSASNWGIRLIGGAEVGRVISIGSIVFDGAASKNGKLKSGDEIISINDINVMNATHQHVVEFISSCTNQVSLVVRRKKFADAIKVELTKNPDEGFGFVIISSGSCAFIGRIIEGSPADRCQQLYVKDRIIAVNGRNITADMQHPDIVNMIKECGSTLSLRIIPDNCYTVELVKNVQNDNFGFTMRGGSEYGGTPLYILRVAPDGLARDLLKKGDQIIEINGIPTVGMTHRQAASIITYSDPIVKLKLRRNYVTPPSLLVDSPRALQKYKVTAEPKTVNPNVTPSLLHDGSTSSDFGVSTSTILSQPLQHSSLVDQRENNGQVTSETSNLIYSQSMPLYAT